MKQLLLNIINSNSPESHRRVVVLFLTLNLAAMGWVLLLRATPISNKDLLALFFEISAMLIGAGWTTLVFDKFSNKKKNEPRGTQGGEQGA